MNVTRITIALALSLIFLPQRGFSQGGLNQRIDELSQQIATEMAEQQKTTIAVVEFTDLQGNITNLGRYISEELITRLFQTKQFKVIERQLLNKVLTEQDLSLTGIIDPTSAKELEKILGVDAIASGTITDLAQSLRVNARLISTETGEIFAVASTEIFKDESVMGLLAASTKPVFNPVSPVRASETVTTANAGNWSDSKLTFKDEVFTKKSVYRVTLVSLEVSDQNNLKINLKFENLREQTTRTYLLDPENNAYIIDQDGTQYSFIQASRFEKKQDTVPLVAYGFSVTFAPIEKSINSLSIVLRINDGYAKGNLDVAFRNLQLQQAANR